MRPQQNRRMGGNANNRRNNGNNGGVRRAPANPLARNYESSGPDVKIRGNAQHIADKYLALARDAQASGDRIMGENYLQHAEHYNRIILSAQPQEKEARQPARAAEPDEAEAAEPQSRRAAAEELGDAPQPVIEGVPSEMALLQPRAYQSNGEADAESGAHAARPRRRLPARRNAARAGFEPRANEGNGAEAAEQPAAEASANAPRKRRAPRPVAVAPVAVEPGDRQPDI